MPSHRFHRSVAPLALLAVLLLALVPATGRLAQSLGTTASPAPEIAAAHGAHHHANGPAAPAAMPGHRHGASTAGDTALPASPHRGHGGHECDYCPLLASLVAFAVPAMPPAPPTRAPEPRAPATSPVPAAHHPTGLGSRGPPLRPA